ncbi:MAG: GAF domain-containing protein [Anaerolineales bacterium]|nr:GAF domain-containing protein [Anaerolineales bacterium]
MTDQSRPKILYIEDDRESRLLVCRLLGERFEVIESGDPLQGIELARGTPPDLVLLDLSLPNMTGREVATRLKSILPEAPLVALTSDKSPGVRERTLAAGFDGFLTKPVNIECFASQIEEYLLGKREELPDAEAHLREYQSELVEHLEAKVRELSNTANRNYHLHKQNQEMINILIRRQSMLEAGARVSHAITSILDLNDLLRAAVEVLCSEFDLYYSGIFLLAEDGVTLRLAAGHGPAGEALLGEGFHLPVDRHSMTGSVTLDKKAFIASDVGGESSHFKNPYLPETRSEMALPLIFKDRVLGTLTVQSVELNAFTEDDITALQALADQVAIAIHNAQLLRQLEQANQELLRSKTYEAIATATGEAIHWVGNKAAPVPGAAQRVRADLLNLVAALHQVILATPAGGPNPLQEVAENVFAEADQAGIDLAERAAFLLEMPAKQRAALISLESILEDLQIIEGSADTILNIKEDLIGPARQRKPIAFSLTDELSRLVAAMALPTEAVMTDWPPDLPLVYGDPRQIDQVFNNLIKNAWEALVGNPEPRIQVSLRRDDDPGMLRACVRDNGPGIPPEIQERIWVSFFTTKGGRGGTGLGLSACMEIVRQNGGKIWLESEAGKGAAFYVLIPIGNETQIEEAERS